MKKRIVSLFLCLLTVLTLLPVPANAAKPKVKITQQPESAYVELGEEVSISVAATGKGLKYQWYYRNPGSSKYRKSSIKTDTYTCTMTEARSGRKLYCVIKDKYGNSVKSKTVTCKIPTALEITQQPESDRAALGKKVSVTVKAKGDGLKYQWYNIHPGSDTVETSSVTKATYCVKMNTSRTGRQIYCVITDRYGNSVQTDTVQILATGKFKSSQYSLKLEQEKDLSQQLNFSIDDTMTWESSDPEVATVDENGVVKALKKGKTTITATGIVTGIRSRCTVQVGKVKQVALTFDDGPSTHTARLLDYLETTDAKVTFFMVGNRISSYKKTVKRMAEQGHELGYHSYAHDDQTTLSSSQIKSDYKKSNKILKSITGQEFTLWRTPGGSYSDRVVNCVPLPHIMWSASTADWKTRNETAVYNSILELAEDGAIILLHDLHGTTVDGAIRAMKKLEKEGYEFVTVTELLSRDGTAPKACTTYRKA